MMTAVEPAADCALDRLTQHRHAVESASAILVKLLAAERSAITEVSQVRERFDPVPIALVT